MFYLMKLPIELRLKIYRYSMNYDGELVPFPSEHERFIANEHSGEAQLRFVGGHLTSPWKRLKHVKYASYWPLMALIGVNRQVSNEAREAFLRTNEIRFPTWSFQQHCNDLKIGNPLNQWLPYCTMLSLKPSMQGGCLVIRKDDSYKAYNGPMESSETSSALRKYKDIQLRHTWSIQLQPLSKALSLRSVTLDLSEVDCTSSLCNCETKSILVILHTLKLLHQHPPNQHQTDTKPPTAMKWKVENDTEDTDEMIDLAIQCTSGSPFRIAVKNLHSEQKKAEISSWVEGGMRILGCTHGGIYASAMQQRALSVGMALSACYYDRCGDRPR